MNEYELNFKLEIKKKGGYNGDIISKFEVTQLLPKHECPLTYSRERVAEEFKRTWNPEAYTWEPKVDEEAIKKAEEDLMPF